MSSWHARRFEPDPRKSVVACAGCGRTMYLPASKVGMYKSCSAECAAEQRKRQIAARERACEQCGTLFIPRPAHLRAGGGRFCSPVCALPVLAAGRTPAVAAKRGAARRAAFLSGAWQPLRGEANGHWKGGHVAYLERQRAKDPELRRARRRAYLQANPAKVREWTKKRRGAMTGRLPRGTVARIGALQRWRCAACSVGIRAGFHTDHRMPLALGGQHEPSNIQLLCKTCNLRKSARHPVDFMRLMGRLL